MHPLNPGIADVQNEKVLTGKDFLGLAEISGPQMRDLLALGALVKQASEQYVERLAGKTLIMLFEKPSLRTRATFEIGMAQLGGHALYLSPAEIGLGSREAVKDVARNISRWADAVLARVFEHQTLVELARYGSVPVINGLCDLEHPCQALGDFLTLQEHKRDLRGRILAWVGDGNNVAHSLIFGAARLDVRMRVATPPGFEPRPWAVDAVRREGADLILTHDPVEAVADADAVYTDVWASMGQEEEATERAVAFRPYQVNTELLKWARPDAVFMHCLPAHRGEEVTDAVMESPNSIVFDQAENRLHIQKAILLSLLS